MLQVHEPGQLADRVVVVVDPQVDPAVVPTAVAAARSHDEQRGRLTTASIAAGRIGGRQARDQELRERPAARQERVGQAVDDRGSGEDVALCREAWPVRPPAQAKQPRPV